MTSCYDSRGNVDDLYVVIIPSVTSESTVAKALSQSICHIWQVSHVELDTVNRGTIPTISHWYSSSFESEARVVLCSAVGKPKGHLGRLSSKLLSVYEMATAVWHLYMRTCFD